MADSAWAGPCLSAVERGHSGHLRHGRCVGLPLRQAETAHPSGPGVADHRSRVRLFNVVRGVGATMATGPGGNRARTVVDADDLAGGQRDRSLRGRLDGADAVSRTQFIADGNSLLPHIHVLEGDWTHAGWNGAFQTGSFQRQATGLTVLADDCRFGVHWHSNHALWHAPRFFRRVGFPFFLLLRRPIQLLGQSPGKPRLGWRDGACLQKCNAASIHAPTGSSGAHGLYELHHAHCNLYYDFLRPRFWVVWKSRAGVPVRHRVGDMVSAIGGFSALAEIFLLWSLGMVVAMPDLPAVGTAAPKAGGRLVKPSRR